jgi:hypothetical protein
MKSDHNNGTWQGCDHSTKQQVTTVTSSWECVDEQWAVTKICPLLCVDGDAQNITLSTSMLGRVEWSTL